MAAYVSNGYSAMTASPMIQTTQLPDTVILYDDGGITIVTTNHILTSLDENRLKTLFIPSIVLYLQFLRAYSPGTSFRVVITTTGVVFYSIEVMLPDLNSYVGLSPVRYQHFPWDQLGCENCPVKKPQTECLLYHCQSPCFKREEHNA